MNGEDTGLTMKLGKSGEAYFLQPVEDVPDDDEKIEELEEKEEEVKKNLGTEGYEEVDDLYKGVEFFEEASLKRMDKVFKKEEEKKKRVESDEEEEPADEGEDEFQDATDSDGDSIEKMQSEDKYKDIINEIETQSEREREKRAQLNKRTSRFGWVWGDTPANEGNNKLESTVRERSKSEAGNDPLRMPVLTSSKSEKADEVKLEDTIEVNAKNKTEEKRDSASRSPQRKGIFRRFIGYLRGRPDDQDANEASSPNFKLQQVPPKKGDFGNIAPKESKGFKSDVGISLCKDLLYTCEKDEVHQIFADKQIDYETFCDRYEEIIEDPKLIVRIHNELYDWRTGAAIILSELVYGKSLGAKTNDFQNKVESYAHRATKDDSAEDPRSGTRPDIVIQKSSDNGEPEKRNIHDFSDDGFKSLPEVPISNKFKKSMSENPTNAKVLKDLDNDNQFNHMNHQLSEGEIEDQGDSEGKIPAVQDIEIPLDREPSCFTDKNSQTKRRRKGKQRYKKTLFLTSDQLKQLNLKYGRNEITYSVDSGFQGTQTNTSRIYFWNHKVKICISDIDGTITKSDVLGHILPRLGRDWSHIGVSQLYTNIRKNGYEFIYLTSRAIGMADSTRAYLQNLEQDANFRLPDGPCIMSPDRLMHSFKREVIDRKPQLFKIAALLNIKNLFREDQSPFYAGFGNRDTDAISYRAVGINFRRIFIVNPKSEVVIFKSMYKKSYPLMVDLVDQMFPPVCSKNSRTSTYCVFICPNY